MSSRLYPVTSLPLLPSSTPHLPIPPIRRSPPPSIKSSKPSTSSIRRIKTKDKGKGKELHSPISFFPDPPMLRSPTEDESKLGESYNVVIIKEKDNWIEHGEDERLIQKFVFEGKDLERGSGRVIKLGMKAAGRNAVDLEAWRANVSNTHEDEAQCSRTSERKHRGLSFGAERSVVPKARKIDRASPRAKPRSPQRQQQLEIPHSPRILSTFHTTHQLPEVDSTISNSSRKGFGLRLSLDGTDPVIWNEEDQPYHAFHDYVARKNTSTQEDDLRGDSSNGVKTTLSSRPFLSSQGEVEREQRRAESRFKAETPGRPAFKQSTSFHSSSIPPPPPPLSSSPLVSPSILSHPHSHKRPSQPRRHSIRHSIATTPGLDDIPELESREPHTPTPEPDLPTPGFDVSLPLSPLLRKSTSHTRSPSFTSSSAFIEPISALWGVATAPMSPNRMS